MYGKIVLVYIFTTIGSGNVINEMLARLYIWLRTVIAYEDV